MKVHIYVLIDPISLKIRYIGRTSNSLNTRLIGHLSKARRGNTHKDLWIKKLMRSEQIPIIKLYKDVEGWKESHRYEQQLINKCLKHGFELVNLDDRGEGSINKIITSHQRSKISKTLKEGYSKGLIKPTKTTKVTIYDLQGNYIQEYKSCSECCKNIGIPQSSLENVLSRRVKRWKNYQITYGENPGIYKINKKEMKNIMKQVAILTIDSTEDKILLFDSYKEAAEYLKVSSPTIRRYIQSGLPYKDNYLITDARIKQGELQETPNKDNLQPSSENDIIVSEKVQRLTGEESTNKPDTSALQPVIIERDKDGKPLISVSFQMIDFSKNKG